MSDSEDSFEALHAELAARGYQDIPEVRGVKPDDRVRHYGQQWDNARIDGTATVLAVMATGRVIQGKQDIELIVRRDKPFIAGGRLIENWADYHTVPIARQ